MMPRTPADALAEAKSEAAFDRAEQGARFMRGVGYGFVFAAMFWAPVVAAIVGWLR